MVDWISTTLGAVVGEGRGRIQTGPFGSQLHASDYVSEGVPCIMPTNLKANRIDLAGIAYISEADADRLRQHRVRAGDIVYSRRGDVTQKALVRPEQAGFFCGTGCLLVRPGSAVDSEFLTYQLSTPAINNWLLNQAVGAHMPNLNTGILSKLPLRIPELGTQRAIASVLSALDAKIDLNHRINAELEALARTIYDYWFVQFDFPDADGRPYRASGGAMVWDEALQRDIPSDWRAVALAELVSVSKCAATPGTTDASEPYVGLEHIPRRRMWLSEWASPGAAASNKLRFRSGDILFGKIRPYFHKVVVAHFDGIVSTDALVLRPKDSTARAIAFQTVFSDSFVRASSAGSTGSKMPRAEWNLMKRHLIAIPPETSQVAVDYASLFCATTEVIATRASETHELTRLRDWLLPLLMNGQARVGKSLRDATPA